jgi:hypothetical protein
MRTVHVYYYYYYYNNFVYYTTRRVCLATRLRENNIYRRRGIFMAPLDFDIGFPRKRSNSPGIQFRCKTWVKIQTNSSNLSTAMLDILRVWCIFFTIECSIFFRSQIMRTLLYYASDTRVRHHLYIILIVVDLDVMYSIIM